MNLIKEYKKSITQRVLNFLFDSNFEFRFKDSIFSKLFVFESKSISVIFIILAIFFYWYEGVLAPYLGAVFFEFVSPVLVILSFYLAPKRDLIFKKFHIWYLIFLLTSLASGLLAVLSGLDVLMIVFGWFFFLQLFLVILIGQSLNLKKMISKIIIILALPNLLYSLYQVAINPGTGYSFSYLESIGTRASGLFGGPNVFALICVIAFLLSAFLFLEEKNRLYLIMSVFFVFGIAFSFSRTGWIAVSVASIYLLYRIRPNFLKFTPFVFLALLVERVRERLFIVFSESYLFDSSIDGRIWSFNNAIYLTLKNPLFGHGPGSYGGKLAYSFGSPIYLEGMQSGYTALHTTDNQFTGILVQTGILGFVGFIFFLIAMGVEIFKRKDKFSIIAASILLAWSFAGLFSNILEFNAITVPAALIFGMALGENKKQ